MKTMEWNDKGDKKVIQALEDLKVKRDDLVKKGGGYPDIYPGFVAQTLLMIRIATGANSEPYNALNAFVNETDNTFTTRNHYLLRERVEKNPVRFNSIIDGCIEHVKAVGLPRVPKESKNLLGEVDNNTLVGIIFSIIAVSFLAGLGAGKFFNDDKPQQPININVPPSTYIVPYSKETKSDTIKQQNEVPQSLTGISKSDSTRHKQ